MAFFTSFRDLTAAGFWTTRMGIDDLQYMGNRSVARWNGCPDAALKKLGVSYRIETELVVGLAHARRSSHRGR